MSVNPPSNLSLDMAKTADPQAMQASVDKLKTIAAGRIAAQTTGENFAHLQAGKGTSAEGLAKTPVSNPAFKKFEAFMLQSFVESMFAGENQAVYGEGIAGGYWKSMMSEAIANQMADAGGIGVARMLEEQSARRIANEAVNSVEIAGLSSTKGQD